MALIQYINVHCLIGIYTACRQGVHRPSDAVHFLCNHSLLPESVTGFTSMILYFHDRRFVNERILNLDAGRLTG